MCRERERIGAATSKRERYFLDTASQIPFAKVRLVFRHWSYIAIFVIKVRWLSYNLYSYSWLSMKQAPKNVVCNCTCRRASLTNRNLGWCRVCPVLPTTGKLWGCPETQEGKSQPKWIPSTALRPPWWGTDTTQCFLLGPISVCPFMFSSQWFVMLSNRT